MATDSNGNSETGGIGGDFDGFLKDEGIFDDVTKTAKQRVADYMNAGQPKPEIDYKAWYDAATDLCVIDCIGWKDGDPRGSLMNLIQYEITLAQDPVIGGEHVTPKQIADCLKTHVFDKIHPEETPPPGVLIDFAYEVRKLKPEKK
jgi:hypothetical protein